MTAATHAIVIYRWECLSSGCPGEWFSSDRTDCPECGSPKSVAERDIAGVVMHPGGNP